MIEMTVVGRHDFGVVFGGAFSAKIHLSMNLHDCRENWCKRRLD